MIKDDNKIKETKSLHPVLEILIKAIKATSIILLVIIMVGLIIISLNYSMNLLMYEKNFVPIIVWLFSIVLLICSLCYWADNN